jgi:hypothetical protein
MDKSRTKNTVVKEVKELISDPKNRIKLDDFVTKYLKAFLEATSLEHFPVQDFSAQKENFLERMYKYEKIVRDLQQIVILLSKWGEAEQATILEKIFSRIAEPCEESAGIVLWLRFSWYPIQILMYSAGIAALSVKKYDVLKKILTIPVWNSSVEIGPHPIIVQATSNISSIYDAFKWIPDKEDKYVPRSEHLFEILNPTIEELLFIGKSYEVLFDDFEVYYALIYIDITKRDWGPIGRFGWKYKRGVGDNPFNRIIDEAKEAKEEWLPLRNGIFNYSLKRFLEVSEVLRQRLNSLPW